MGSRAWLVLQCVAVAVLALLDVLLVYAHSDDQSVKVAVSRCQAGGGAPAQTASNAPACPNASPRGARSNDVGLDLFGLSSPFVLLLLADTTLNVFFQSAGTVRFFSRRATRPRAGRRSPSAVAMHAASNPERVAARRDVLYMDALLDIGTLGGCYISMAVNTSYWSDPLAFRRCGAACRPRARVGECPAAPARAPR